MTPTPTGRLLGAEQGRDLVLTRTYRAPIEDVWASVTESERTARWFGPWTGDAGPGRTIKVQMAFEEEQPWMDMLGAARDDSPRPDFDDYYPSMAAYYENLAPRA